MRPVSSEPARTGHKDSMRHLIAVTTYFNPLQGRLRRRNYDVFRRELDLPLVAVEWSPEGRFELGDDAAELLVRVSGGDLLWQKERLLNLGMARARAAWPGADLVFLDCDVIFPNPGWSERVVEALDLHAAVQCFAEVAYLPPTAPMSGSRVTLANTAPEQTLPSLASALVRGRPMFDPGASPSSVWPAGSIPLRGNPGMAIALRPAALPGFRFYERNVIGGGDLLLAAALAGRLEEAFTHRVYTSAHQADLRAWAARSIAPGVGLGCVAERLMHLWHGDLRDRRYSQRNVILQQHEFDPVRDVDQDPTGGLRLASHAGALRRAVAEYLASRNDA